MTDLTPEEYAAPWSKEEKLAWSPPGMTCPSKFAGETRVLTSKESAYPGLWDNERSPYLCELMDRPAEVDGPKITVITKPAQVGASECSRNLIRYWAHHDPGPCLIVYPDVNTAKSQFIERLVPLFESDGLLVKFHRADGMISISLQTMDIYVTWASNAARLASRPVRYLILDEVDKMKFPPTAREQAPLALAIARLRTFKQDARAVLISTPSIRQAPITEYYDRCDLKREWRILCPHCNEHFYPSWSAVEWSKRQEDEDDINWASRIDRDQDAWLVCPSCKGRLNDQQRSQAAAQGAWFSLGEEPNSPRKVGYKFNVLGTGWTSTTDLAAKWIEIHRNPQQLQEFINQDLGEVFEEKASILDMARLKDCIDPECRLRVAPPWVGVCIAGVDSQLDGWFWLVMGYGAGKRSITLDYGFCDSLEMVKAATLDNSYPIQGTTALVGVSCLAIDARARPDITERVLSWALTDPRIRPIMGVGTISKRGGDPIREVPWQFELKRPGNKSVWLSGKRYSVDVNYFKNLLVAHMTQGIWQIASDVSTEFLRHFESESKVKRVVRGRVEWVWQKKSERSPNHWWDCAVYIEAIAWRLRLEFIPTEDQLDRQRKAITHEQEQDNQGSEGKWIEGFKF